MRRVVLLVAVLAVTGTAAADPEPPFEPIAAAYLGGGASVQTVPQDFKDGWDPGWSFGGGVGYHVFRRVEIRTLLFYNSFGLDTSGLTGVSGGDFSMLELLVDAKVFPTRPDDRLEPYVVAGVGWGGARFDEATFPEPVGTLPQVSETKFGYGIGAGLDVHGWGASAVFVEARHVWVRTSVDHTGYLPLRAGVRIRLGGPPGS